MSVVLGSEESILCCCGIVLLAALLRGGHDGKGFDKRVAGNNDAASVDARLADGAFEPGGALEKLVYNGIVGLEGGIQVRRLRTRILERDFWRIRH